MELTSLLKQKLHAGHTAICLLAIHPADAAFDQLNTKTRAFEIESVQVAGRISSENRLCVSINAPIPAAATISCT